MSSVVRTNAQLHEALQAGDPERWRLLAGRTMVSEKLSFFWQGTRLVIGLSQSAIHNIQAMRHKALCPEVIFPRGEVWGIADSRLMLSGQPAATEPAEILALVAEATSHRPTGPFTVLGLHGPKITTANWIGGGTFLGIVVPDPIIGDLQALWGESLLKKLTARLPS